MSTEEIIELDVELVTHTKDLDISIDVDREQYDVTLVLSKTDVDDITSEEILITEQLELLLDKHSLQIEFEEVDEVDVAGIDANIHNGLCQKRENQLKQAAHQQAQNKLENKFSVWLKVLK